MSVLLPVAVALISWFCPTKIQLLLLFANVFLPDSVPMVDEVIQFVAFAKNLGSS